MLTIRSEFFNALKEGTDGLVEESPSIILYIII
jgi:hypothetical protein